MDNNFQQIFTIHFPEKQVYIEHTFKTLQEKMKEIKGNKDHRLYNMLKDNPNPEIRFECYRDQSYNEKLVASNYKKNYYKILN